MKDAKIKINRKLTLFMFIGLALGLIVGEFLALTTSLSWQYGFVLGLLSGPALGYGAFSLAESTFVKRPNRQQQAARRAILFGSAAGFVLGCWHYATTNSGWLQIPLITLTSGGVIGLLTHRLLLAHTGSKPTQTKLAIPVRKNFVSRSSKLDAIKGLLKTNQTRHQDNESEVQVATDLHSLELVKSLTFSGGLLILFLWGATHFAGWLSLLMMLTTGYVPWGVVVVLIGLTVRWYLLNKGNLVPKTVLPNLIITIGVWMLARFLGATSLLQGLLSGSSRPWLIGALLSLMWIGWRWLKWHYGFYAVSDKRLMKGTVMPSLLPNSLRSLPLSKVASCDSFESWLGNYFRYRRFVIDGVGDKDGFWKRLTPVPHAKEIDEAVST